MSKVYKIHPAIGIMRVGDSPSEFFIGPEIPGQSGVELTAAGEQPVQTYKENGRIKRQAARFRVFEYDQSAGGTLTLVREVTASEATITWKVELVNKKAAGNNILGTPGRRNNAISDRGSLTIKPGEREISGVNQSGVSCDGGKFLGVSVLLGELKTDSAGRLLVLSGHGKSEGIPSAQGGAIPPLPDFANNDRWYDDVSDGPVTATVKFDGQSPITAVPAWVIAAPPDFAPGIGGVVSLYEVVFQAAITASLANAPATPSFRKHIFPTVSRSSSLRWTHTWGHWSEISLDWAKLSDKSDPANQTLRQQAFNRIMNPNLNRFEMPHYLETALQKWVAGNFDDDWANVPAVSVTPEGLDRSALEACVGANFFPGIEGGALLKTSSLYAEPFRLSPAQVSAGAMTEVMALPWQADFHDCADDWWPSQRPNDIFTDQASIPNDPVLWAAGVQGAGQAGRRRMVTQFARLGFIVPKTIQSQTIFVEEDRDPTLPR